MESNVNKHCRLCLSKVGPFLYLFNTVEADTNAITLPMQISMCTSVNVSNTDEISKIICIQCRDYVQQWYAFRVNSLKSDLILRRQFKDANLPPCDSLNFTYSTVSDDDIKKHQILHRIPESNSTNACVRLKFQCEKCPDSFYYQTDLETHLQLIHVETKDAKRSEQSKLSGKQPKQVRPCYEKWCCDQLFQSRNSFRFHAINNHTNGNKYSCDECGKQNFISEKTLRRHKMLHSGKYGCRTCGRTFTCHASLRIHERDKHENDHPFICDVCGKAYVTELRLNYHQRFHTGEKEYVCEECGVAVMTSSSLAKHKRIHSKVKPHVCHLCGKGFIVRGRLVEHIRVHTGERPYTCDICSKAFTMLDKLKRHIKTHSSEKPFSCEICGNAYTTNHGLSVHRKSHNFRQQL